MLAPHRPALLASPAIRGGPAWSFGTRLVAGLLAPLLLGVLAWWLMRRLGGETLGNPLLTSAALLPRLLHPLDRGDSWGPMIQALATLHQQPDARLYDMLFFQQHEKFQYAPTSLLWLEALGKLFPLDAANLNRLNGLVFLANAVGCAVLLRACTASMASRPRAAAERNLLTAAAFLAPFVFWPTVYGYTIGQIQLWIDLLATAAVLFWCLGWKLSSGIAIGLACTIKPQLGLVLAWALVWREWRLACGLAAVATIAGLWSVLQFGLGNNLNFLDVLNYISRHGESFRANQSVNGLLNRLLFDGNNLTWSATQFAPFHRVVYWGTLGSSLLLVVLPLASRLRPGADRPGVFDVCFAMLCFTMASPVAWEHHYGIALPCFVVAVAHMRQSAAGRPGVPALPALLASAWVLLGSNLQVLNWFSDTWFNPLQSYMLAGGVLLLLALSQLRRVA